jgi:uncharacterized repeat protein (TIGR01451 family)
MQNSVWKLTALVGVVGIGFLVVLQAQRGLSVPGVAPDPAAAGSSQSAAADLGDAVAFDAFAQPEAADPAPPTTIRQRARVQDADPFAGERQAAADAPQVRLASADPFAAASSGPRSLTNEQVAGAAPVPKPQAGNAPQPAVQLASGEEEPEFFGLFDDAPPAAKPETADPEPAPRAATPAAPMAADDDEPAPLLEPEDAVPATTGESRQPRPMPLLETVDPLAEPGTAGPPAGASVPIPAPVQQAIPPEPADALDALDPFAMESSEPAPDEENPDQPADPAALEATPVVADDPFAMESVESEAAPEKTEDSSGNEQKPAPEQEPPALLRVSEQSEEPAAETPSAATPEPAAPAIPEAATESAPELATPPESEPAARAAPEQVPADETPESNEPAASEPPPAGERPRALAEPKPLPKIEASQPAAPPIEPGRVRLYEREPVRPADPASLPVISPARGAPRASAGAALPVETGGFPGNGRVRADVPRGSQQPRLTIEKLAPTHAVLGQPLIYEIHVKNIGSSSAHQVVVEDRVPAGTQLTGSIPRAELVEKSLVWRFGELHPGQEQIIKVCVVPTTEGQVGSVATVNFVAEVAAETTITAPRLEMVLTGPKQVPLGQPVTFNFKVTNKGTGDATGVYVRSILPEELRHPDGSDLEYEIGVLPAGKSRELALSMNAVRAGEIVKHAVLTADGGIEIERRAALEIVGDRLALSRKGPEQRYVGRTATYSNTVTNDGLRPIQGAVVTEAVPPGMEFVEASAGGTYDPERRVVEWRIEQLAAKENQVLNVTLKCAAIGEQQSVVTASTAGGAQAEVASQTQVEGFAALGLEVPTVDGPVDVGEPVALRVQARNRGTVASTNVRLTIRLPAELELVRIQGPAKYAQADGQVRFEPVPAIAGGEQAEFELLLKPRQPGNARVEVEIASDQLKKPLSREEVVYVLSPAG